MSENLRLQDLSKCVNRLIGIGEKALSLIKEHNRAFLEQCQDLEKLRKVRLARPDALWQEWSETEKAFRSIVGLHSPAWESMDELLKGLLETIHEFLVHGALRPPPDGIHPRWKGDLAAWVKDERERTSDLDLLRCKWEYLTNNFKQMFDISPPIPQSDPDKFYTIEQPRNEAIPKEFDPLEPGRILRCFWQAFNDYYRNKVTDEKRKEAYECLRGDRGDLAFIRLEFLRSKFVRSAMAMGCPLEKASGIYREVLLAAEAMRSLGKHELIDPVKEPDPVMHVVYTAQDQLEEIEGLLAPPTLESLHADLRELLDQVNRMADRENEDGTERSCRFGMGKYFAQAEELGIGKISETTAHVVTIKEKKSCVVDLIQRVEAAIQRHQMQEVRQRIAADLPADIPQIASPIIPINPTSQPLADDRRQLSSGQKMNPCAVALREFIDFADSIINLPHPPNWEKPDPILWEQFGFPTSEALHSKLANLEKAVIASSSHAWDALHQRPHELAQLLHPVVKNLTYLPGLPPASTYATGYKMDASNALWILRPLLTALEGNADVTSENLGTPPSKTIPAKGSIQPESKIDPYNAALTLVVKAKLEERDISMEELEEVTGKTRQQLTQNKGFERLRKMVREHFNLFKKRQKKADCRVPKGTKDKASGRVEAEAPADEDGD